MKKRLENYKKRLEEHDWWYEMSEDPSVYVNGKTEYNALRRMSNLSESHLELFEQIKYEKTQLSQHH